jgi:serpin B
MPRATPVRALALLAVLCAAGRTAGADARAVSPQVVEANTRFAADLYGALSKGPGNLVFSPLSVSTAFAMLRVGARGETAADLDRALRLPPESAAMFRDLLEVLNTPRYPAMRIGEMVAPEPAFHLAVANGLFGQQGWALRREFSTTLSDAFGAEMQTLDFTAGDAARRSINDWVAKKTRDKIRDLIPEGQPVPETRLVLANAVYFKAAWASKFSTSATQDGPFHAPGGDVTARLMHDTDHHRYAETPEAQVLELSYLRGETSMVVVLPRAKDGLPAVERALTADAWKAWTAPLQGERVRITLPKWKHTVAVDLGKPMTTLGAGSSFDPRKADFTGIAEKPPLFVTSALHQAFIAVDEEGTEAAAATALAPGAAAAPPAEPKVFTADRPFLYAIVHRPTGTILFLGRVVDPTR